MVIFCLDVITRGLYIAQNNINAKLSIVTANIQFSKFC